MPFWRKHSTSTPPDAPSSQSHHSTPGAGPSSQVLPPPPLLVPTTPAPGIQVVPPPQTQPRTIKLTPGALLTLPYRLLHPPPAKSQLATWSITPQFDIRLEDILDRKHLPPLGLKDFEEWLLFVEHTPEYLYFVLWLREYTFRYSAWKQQVKQQQQTPHYNHSPLETSTSSKQKKSHFRGRWHKRKNESPTFTHHGLHHSVPRPTSPSPSDVSTSSSIHSRDSRHSSTASSSSPTRFRNPKSHHSHSIRSNPHHTSVSIPPAPPPSLATFYMRAKETFLAPGAAYELHVPEDAVAVFNLKSCPSGSSEHLGMGAGAGGSAHYPSYSPTSVTHYVPWSSGYNNYNHYGSINHHPQSQNLPLPPDPEIFAELKGIVEDRLKACLARFVVATYNNVGTPRAVCGCAGGIVIGTTSSVPILATNFALHAPRWWRIFALPGMWLGMTIFMSAMYGVCMMIYVFGDLRQLRSFELTRPARAVTPPPSSPISPTSPNHLSPQKDGQNTNKENRDRVVKVPMVQPITRPPKVRLVDVRSASVSRTALSKEKGRARAKSEGDIGSPTSPAITVTPARASIQAPPPAATRTSTSVNSRSSHSSHSSISSSSSSGTHTDSGLGADDSSSDSSSDSDSDSDLSHKPPLSPRRPRILISDAYYDEHPSPEGFATTTTPFPFAADGPGTLLGSRRGSLATGAGGGGGNGVDGEGEEEITVTASFIKGFVYDEGDALAYPKSAPKSRSRCGRSKSKSKYPHQHRVRINTRSEGHGDRHSTFTHTTTTDDEDEDEDIEAQQQARIAEKQPVDEFDFDGLPPRLGLVSQGSFGYRPRYPQSQSQQHPQYHHAHSQSQPQLQHGRSQQTYNTQPHYPRSHYAQYPQAGEKSDGALNLDGGEEAEEEGKRPRLLVVLIWMALSWIQVKCSPGNAADHHMAAAHRSTAPSSEKITSHSQSQNQSPPNLQIPTVNEKSASAFPTADKSTDKVKRKPLSWRESFRRVSQVPAFASPLTPVLNPIVGRAQWEIVVRSAFISAVVCGAVVGALMGVPVPS